MTKKYEGKTVQIMMMSECPNNCTHCCIHYKGHIEFNKIEEMIEQYQGEGKEVILNGTELLMNERYLQLCKKAGQDFIYTNGRLFNEKNRKLLKKYNINRVSVSLHYGIQEQLSHEKLEDISQIIRDAVAEGFEIRVLCDISKDNYKILPEIASYVNGLGVKSLKFINMIKEGRAEDIGDIFLDKEELKEFFSILEETRKQYNPEEFYVTRNGAFGDDEIRKNNFYCPAGKDWIILTPDGYVYPCNGLNY